MAGKLSTYHAKRDFKSTPEPKGAVKRTKGRLFIVQKHDATRLHYDFRLELDGVLLSWAVTRGPSLNPADKRLAVKVEDHPVAYGGFEGVIPSGYGAGTVMLWDRGQWAPQGDPHEGLKKGELKIVLFGERLKGGFVLVRLRPRPGEKAGRENWLLIKERDDWAEEDVVATEEWTKSVKSKRSLDQIETTGEAYKRGKTYKPDGKAAKRPPAKRAAKVAKSAAKPRATQPRARKTKAKARPKSRTRAERTRVAKVVAPRSAPRRPPRFIPPQLATLVDAPPQGEGWLHEIKFDGYRIIAVVHRGRARLITRNKLDWTHKYTRIAEAVEKLGLEDATLDGELVASNEAGEADFSRMQAAGTDETVPLTYHLFDLLNLGGQDLTGLPLVERKARLEKLLKSPPDGISYSEHIAGDGERVVASACGLKLEGVISKEANAPYRSGRVGSWVKSKCIGNDEFVIGGFRTSDKRGRPFSSLILGEHVRGKLVYRGRVGTGFDDADMKDLALKFSRRLRKTSPFAETPAEARRGAVWLKPDLVAQIAYLEVTPDGSLRHPSFLGLREDKPAADVKARRDAHRAEVEAVKPAKAKKTAPKAAAKRATPKSAKARSARAKPSRDGAESISGVRLTSPDKVLWPEADITKEMLARYYAEHATHILPYLKDRPLSYLRCPEGREGQCFFQKHRNEGMPEEIDTVDIEEKDGEVKPYLVLRSAKALVASAQVGAMELHVWGARADDVQKPERIVFDLDPDTSLKFNDVRDAAFEVRDVLNAAGLKSYPLLTGGKGVHVVIPIARRNSWDEVKAFARGFAEAMSAANSERYVSQASKAKREGRIFIDWLRNGFGATAVAPYTVRARENAPVAAPITWAELKSVDSAAEWTLMTMGRRLKAQKSDPWAGYAAVRQSLTSEIRRHFSLE
jgi:bifunctional non-homologous end joining protein LigD